VNTIAAALAAARQKIDLNEARLLLRNVLRCSAAHLEAHREDPIDVPIAQKFFSLVDRRQNGEPIAYLTQQREFYGRVFHVAPGVLIPRPETELIVDIVLEKYRTQPIRPEPVEGISPHGASAYRILDIGTGSGCLAITLALELPRAEVTALDVSPDALAIAKQNARQLAAKVRFIESDWFASIKEERFDVIVSNPPYIAEGDTHLVQGDLRFEPTDALVSGKDGLKAIRMIVSHAPRYLNPRGLLLVEHGYDQADRVHALLESHGFRDIEQHRDLAGIVRVSMGR
jgi:release factor glutamine methyltransferase